MKTHIYIITGVLCLGSLRAAEPTSADQQTGQVDTTNAKKQKSNVVRETAAQGKTDNAGQASGKRGASSNKAGIECNARTGKTKKAGVQCDNKAGLLCDGRTATSNASQASGKRGASSHKAGIECNARTGKTKKAGSQCDGIRPAKKKKVSEPGQN